MKIAEVQRRLSIGRTRVYQLLAKREIPAVRIGRSLRVRREDLERFIEDNRY